jgi:hypothetical protein
VSRRSKTVVDPQALERIRAVRATEDSAISEVFRHVGLVEAAKGRRAEKLRTLDVDVRRAEEALAEARGALVTVAGAKRAAAMLGVTAAAMRRLVSGTGQSSKPASPGSAMLSRQDDE